jgi:hypothetical protein
MGLFEWAIVVVACAIFVWRFWHRQGNLDFWKQAANHPDLAFIFFKVEKCWFLDQVPADVQRSKLAGPFRLFVPSVGRHVKVWGLHPDYLESQAKFIEGLGRNPIYGFLRK